jgi:transposase
MADRERSGREASPTAAILDSQSIKTADQKGASKGYDAGKKVKGRKRHILTDTDGRLLAIEVHGADIQDRDGAKGVLKRSRARFPFVECVYVDGGYAGRLVRWAKDKTHIVLEVVKRRADQTGFAVIRRRWVVERSFAWIVKNRRFVRDYEQLTAVAETIIMIAATVTLIRRWQ